MAPPPKAIKSILRGLFIALWCFSFAIIGAFNYLIALYSGKEDYYLYSVIVLIVGFSPIILSIFLKMKKKKIDQS
tara:strand:- start:640 stop:864 length:225 start_codon:yes stop_codon:yes gene_type:complete